MMRAGFIKRLSAGIYTYMPMGLRVIRKVEAHRPRGDGPRRRHRAADAGDAAGRAVAGEWPLCQKYGPELMRVKDRHDRDFVDPADQRGGHHRHRAPGAAQLPRAAEEFLSHPDQVPRRAPAAFRRDARARVHDEGCLFVRPRHRRRACQLRPHVCRLRAHLRAHGLDLSRRRGRQRQRSAASARTSSRSSPRPAKTRWSTARNRTTPPTWSWPKRWRRQTPRAAPALPNSRRPPTPGKSTCEDVAQLLGLPLERTVKSLVLATDAKTDAGDAAPATLWLLLVRGDHALNEVKVGKLAGLSQRLSLRDRGRDRSALRQPAGLPRPDRHAGACRCVSWPIASVAAMSDFVCGANERDFHYTGVNWGRDLPEPDLVADIRNVVDGDPSPDGTGRARRSSAASRSATCFLLGSYYSKKHERHLSRRRRQAATDADGLLRHRHHAHSRRRDRAEPRRARHRSGRFAIAPFEVVVCPDRLRPLARGQASRRCACTSRCWEAGVDAILDDRGERPGRDVRRLGADRRAAPNRLVGSRPEGAARPRYQGRRDAQSPP